jgi:hypothetical protein
MANAAVRTEWFADIDREATHFKWQAVLCESDSGTVLTSASTWFEAEAECIDFIRTYLVGAVLDPEVKDD